MPPTQERDVLRREALAALQGVLDRLPPAQRAAFVLYEIEELHMADVARILDCPVQTAYSRLHAARREVLGALAPDVAGEDARKTQVKP
jgi:RNA polymerase sigma-70 factor, ECF subfamily